MNFKVYNEIPKLEKMMYGIAFTDEARTALAKKAITVLRAAGLPEAITNRINFRFFASKSTESNADTFAEIQASNNVWIVFDGKPLTDPRDYAALFHLCAICG